MIINQWFILFVLFVFIQNVNIFNMLCLSVRTKSQEWRNNQTIDNHDSLHLEFMLNWCQGFLYAEFQNKTLVRRNIIVLYAKVGLIL